MTEENRQPIFPQYPAAAQGLPIANRDQAKPLQKIIRHLFSGRKLGLGKPFHGKHRAQTKHQKKVRYY